MNEDQHDEQLPLPFPDDPDFQTHTRPSGQPGGTPVPGPALVTLVIQGHSDIPLSLTCPSCGCSMRQRFEYVGPTWEGEH